MNGKKAKQLRRALKQSNLRGIPDRNLVGYRFKDKENSVTAVHEQCTRRVYQNMKRHGK